MGIEKGDGYMQQIVEAVFDGGVLRPDEPLALEPNTRVRIVVEPVAPPAKKSASFLSTAASLHLDGPPDWSANIDQYLYGGEPEHEG